MVAKEDEKFYEKIQNGEKNSAIIRCLNYRLTFMPHDYPQKEMTILEQMLREPTSYSPAEYPMCITGSWAIGDIRKNNPDGKFGFFTTPWSDQAEENTPPIGVDTAFMVSAQTKHPDEVMKFMEHLTSAEGVRQWYENAKCLRLYQWKQRIWIQSL